MTILKMEGQKQGKKLPKSYLKTANSDDFEAKISDFQRIYYALISPFIFCK